MKKKTPLVSIIMNCYNGEKYLKQSINSVLSQNFKNWELIFWDNNSTDNSKKILKSYRDNRIKYYFSKKTHNLYKARNLAINKTKGKYICFLDVDDWWARNKLNTQVNIFNKNKYLDLIFSNFYVFNELTKTKKLFFEKYLLKQRITQNLLNNYRIGILTVMLKKNFFLKKNLMKITIL